MAIEKLYAGATQDDPLNSTGTDVATAVNALIDANATYLREIYVENFRQEGFTDQQTIDATIAAAPVSACIRFENNRTYTATISTDKFDFLKLSGNATIKPPSDGGSSPTLKIYKANSVVDIAEINIFGDKENQSASSRRGLEVLNASILRCSKIKSSYNVTNGIYAELCDNVIVLDSLCQHNGFSSVKGDLRNIKASGINTYRCDNVYVSGGDYSQNSYLGVRSSGYEDAFSAIPDWTSSTAVSVGAEVRPNARNKAYAKCITAGTTGISAPTWTGPDTAVNDGTVVWQMISPLANNFTAIGVKAKNCGSDFGGNEWGIGITVASFTNVKMIACDCQENEGNNIDTNRCFGTELIATTAKKSVRSHGFNPDYTGDVMGLAGGDVKVIGGDYSENHLNGILFQCAYKGTEETSDYGDILITGATIAKNSGAGIAGETSNRVKIKDNILKDNGTLAQIAILQAGTTSRQVTDVWGSLTIKDNEFSDTRSNKADHNVYFGLYTNASNPRYNKMVVEKPIVTENKFGDYELSATKSGGPQRGGVDYYNQMKYEGNTGDGSGVITVITAASISSGFIDMDNYVAANALIGTATDVKGILSSVNNKRVSIYFTNGSAITIHDADTPSGSGGNIQLKNNASITPTAGSILEFIYISGRWQEI